MNWKNALKDGFPLDKQEVLISVKGVNYVVTYEANQNGFQWLHGETFFKLTNDTIYWTEISIPNS